MAELESVGALAVTLEPVAEAAGLHEPRPGETPLWSGVEVTALFAARTEALAAARRLESRGHRSLRLDACADRDWVAAGRAGFVPLCFGERLWIVPAWHAAPEPSGVNVLLEPGLAFGTGTHPSTALCLEWLARAAIAGREVLDYGTGSGILAVAAAKLGARRVWAVDSDPQALEAARANARLNGVEIEFCAAEAPLPQAVEVVVANILAVPLVQLAPLLLQHCAGGGRILLSGFDAAQADVVAAAYASGARLLATRSRNGWVALELEKLGQER